MPGLAAWALRVDVRVVEDAGNAGDAAAAAALAALLHFRLPEVTLSGRSWTVHAARERVPRPLAFHHTPVSVTLAAIRGVASAPVLLADPTSAESTAAGASVTVAANAHGELCGLAKSGAAPLPLTTLSEAALAAAIIAKLLILKIREALAAEEGRELIRAKASHTAAGRAAAQ